MRAVSRGTERWLGVLTSMRSTFLPFAVPDTDQAELDQVAEALRSGWVTTGPKTHQFEAELPARRRQARHRGQLLHRGHAPGARGHRPAGAATRSSPRRYTFAATAEVIRYFDARPVLVDVDAGSLNIDPDLIEAAITPADAGPSSRSTSPACRPTWTPSTPSPRSTACA